MTVSCPEVSQNPVHAVAVNSPENTSPLRQLPGATNLQREPVIPHRCWPNRRLREGGGGRQGLRTGRQQPPAPRRGRGRTRGSLPAPGPSPFRRGGPRRGDTPPPSPRRHRGRAPPGIPLPPAAARRRRAAGKAAGAGPAAPAEQH